MLKFLTAFLLAFILSFAICIYTLFPWWSFTIGIFFIGYYFNLNAFLTFFSNFMGVAACWFFWAVYKDYNNNHILSIKMSQILMHSNRYEILYFISALIGGILGGFAALAGKNMQRIMTEKRKKDYIPLDEL
ncbi:MAG: hypothetical protein QM539_05565 [Alphaproteobacteria bacterium]|nr:hypothetical protein [Alphaproteobacteria bacterium]